MTAAGGVARSDSMLDVLGNLPLASGPTVDFDRTVLLQAVLFVLLLLVLRPLLFDPILRVFEERDRRTEGVREQARRLEQRASELLSAYQEQHERVLRAANEQRERMRHDTAKLEASILAEARARAAAVVDQGRRTAASEAEVFRAGLEDRARRLAREIASALLGREVS